MEGNGRESGSDRRSRDRTKRNLVVYLRLVYRGEHLFDSFPVRSLRIKGEEKGGGVPFHRKERRVPSAVPK